MITVDGSAGTLSTTKGTEDRRARFSVVSYL